MNDIRFEYEEYTDTIHYWKEGMRYQLDVRNLQDCVPIFNTLAEANQELYKENDKLKNEINMLKVTIGRNEAYIDRLTHTSEWKTSAQDNKSYHTVLKEWEEEMIDKYSDKRKVKTRRYE